MKEQRRKQRMDIHVQEIKVDYYSAVHGVYTLNIRGRYELVFDTGVQRGHMQMYSDEGRLAGTCDAEDDSLFATDYHNLKKFALTDMKTRIDQVLAKLD